MLLIGGSTLFRTGLCGLIEKSHGIEVTAHAANPAVALRQVNGVPADIVLLDIDDAAETALSNLQELRGEMPAAKLLIFAIGSNPELSRRMVLAGARGVISKDTSADHLLTAIRRVHEGELWVDRTTTAQIVSDAVNDTRGREIHPEHARIASLTTREKEVIALVAQGFNNKAIAAHMNISDNTVRHHLTSIFGKLGVPDRLGLVIYAFRYKLVAQQA